MSCEDTQIEISAWIDGEIEPWDALPLTDHLLTCAACSAFFERARGLERALVMAPAPNAVPPVAPRSFDRSRRLAPWALPLAATVLLALGGFALGQRSWRELAHRSYDGAPDGATAPMTDARFVGIARELLQSDARYRSEMLRVMTEAAERRPLEGTVDDQAGGAPRDAGERPAAAPGS